MDRRTGTDPPSRARWLWLIAAALLVIAAAWLVRIPEPREPMARPQVEMPRYLRPEERQRMLSRLRPPLVDAGAPAPRSVTRCSPPCPPEAAARGWSWR